MNRFTVARTKRKRGRCSLSQRFLAARRSASRAGFTTGSPRSHGRLGGRFRSRRPCSCPTQARCLIPRTRSSLRPPELRRPPEPGAGGVRRPGPAREGVANPIVPSDLVHLRARKHLLDGGRDARVIGEREPLGRRTERQDEGPAVRGDGLRLRVRQRVAIRPRGERRRVLLAQRRPHLDAEPDRPGRGRLLLERCERGIERDRSQRVQRDRDDSRRRGDVSTVGRDRHAATGLRDAVDDRAHPHVSGNVGGDRVDERSCASRDRPPAVGFEHQVGVVVGQGVRLRDREEPGSVVRRGAQPGAERVEAVALPG